MEMTNRLEIHFSLPGHRLQLCGGGYPCWLILSVLRLSLNVIYRLLFGKQYKQCLPNSVHARLGTLQSLLLDLRLKREREHPNWRSSGVPKLSLRFGDIDVHLESIVLIGLIDFRKVSTALLRFASVCGRASPEER